MIRAIESQLQCHFKLRDNEFDIALHQAYHVAIHLLIIGGRRRIRGKAILIVNSILHETRALRCLT